MGYGLRLKLKRTEKGYTQRQLGVKAGVTEQSISNYEREKREPSLSVMVNIAKALDADVQELFFKEG